MHAHDRTDPRRRRAFGVIAAGAVAPSCTLLDAVSGEAVTGEAVTDPWQAGRTVVVFFKVTCPVCKMVAPPLTALAEGGARVGAGG